MNEKFRVALSGDFRKENGEPVFPVFDTFLFHFFQEVVYDS